MTYEIKYINPLINKKRGVGQGRYPLEENWCTEARIIERDIYYAFLKHRAQAKYRNESHSLTADEWSSLWTVELWLQRGRKKTDMNLVQINVGLGWHLNNVEVTTRHSYLKRSSEYRGAIDEQTIRGL